ncbi:MAG TPA: Rieske 2Fe-2S domain-containing protein [Methylomirabilota bacterium]|nr:Rieske 2Fe-2S domain-containing protein [Methylomirabilota bacterium]
MSAPAEWSAPCADIPAGGSAKFSLRWCGRAVEAFVVHVAGGFHAYVNRCAHAGTPLDWWPNEFFTDDGHLLICATHGALFVPDTGQCAGGPCGGGALHRLRARVEGDRVVVTSPEDEAADRAGGDPS